VAVGITGELAARSNNFGQDRSKTAARSAYLIVMFANRSRHLNETWTTDAGKPWDTADLFFLISAVERGLSIEEVGGFLRRRASEVKRKRESCKPRPRRTVLQ
jgi:hypothetical protein